jgi:hypothetical protein
MQSGALQMQLSLTVLHALPPCDGSSWTAYPLRPRQVMALPGVRTCLQVVMSAD